MLTYFDRKESLVIELILHPCHQVVDVLRRRTLYGLLDRLPVCPMVFIFWSGWHNGTPFFCAELCDCAVKHVDLVEEVDRVDRHPFVQVLSFGQDHRKPKVPFIGEKVCRRPTPSPCAQLGPNQMNVLLQIFVALLLFISCKLKWHWLDPNTSIHLISDIHIILLHFYHKKWPFYFFLFF